MVLPVGGASRSGESANAPDEGMLSGGALLMISLWVAMSASISLVVDG